MKIYWLILKDLKVEFRRGFELLSLLLFVLLVSLLISQSSYFLSESVLVPSLFILVIFISIFVSTMTFTKEMDKGTIFSIKLAPVHPSLVFTSKFIFTFILVTLNGLIAILFLVLFSSAYNLLNILHVFILFSAYLSVVSSFSSALAMYSESRSSLASMLIFIFVMPIIPSILKMDVLILFIGFLVMFLTFILLFDYIMEV